MVKSLQRNKKLTGSGTDRMTQRSRRSRYAARKVKVFLLLAVAVGLLAAADRLGLFGRRPAPVAETYDGKTFAVVRVIDGDTLDVDRPDGDYPRTRVRLWGVDTPETKKPETPVQHFGPEATAFTRDLCDGKDVRLELEPRRERDNHGRLLAWAYLPDGRLLNRMLVAQGYAYADPRYEHHLYRELRQLQTEARKASRGLWKDVREKDLPYYYRQGKHRIKLR